jgi:DNA-binding NarL/FixJ family response regulator
MAANSILIIDGDPAFREDVEELVARAGLEPTAVGLGRDALAVAAASRPDVVVSDVSLPDMSGYEVCRVLRDQYGEGLPIILVSGERTDALDRTSGLLLGADDYVVKPFHPGEFLARVRRGVARSRPLRVADPASNGASSYGLTPREIEVLDLLAQGMRQPEIADTLVISGKTVSSHIQRILVKLDAHSRAEAIALAWRHGLVGRFAPDVVGSALHDTDNAASLN